MDKRSGRRAELRGRRVAVAVAAAFLPWGEGHALPTGEEIVTPGVSVTRPTTQSMQIHQGTLQKGIVNWQGFSIGATELVNVVQPNASAALLNRVVGNSPSEIFGRLTANGQVFLVNNAGVLFAPGAQVEVGSLLASTLSITDQNFLNGTYQFYNPGNAGSVVNAGSIITGSGGFTALIGPRVQNDGVIIANSGKIALGAGDRVSLDMIGDGLVSISVDQAAFNASVVNTGTLQADGGTVMLKASSANALLDTVINTSGVIRANALVERNGEIVLDGGNAGVVAVGGTLQTAGGGIQIRGDKVAILDGARVDASGDAAGGTISTNATALYVGPNASINADALQSGDGGSVILWSADSTQVHGTITARGAAGGTGGFVETSGGYLDITQAPDVGPGGTWLIDPYNLLVVAGAGTVNNTGVPSFTPNGDESQIGADLIRGQLDGGTNVVLDTGTTGSQEGDITFNAGVFKSALNSSSLQLIAADDVFINAPIEMASGNFNVTAGGDMVVRSLANAMGGSMNIALGGDLSVLGTGGAAQLGAQTGQAISARSVEVTAQGGGNARLTNGSFFPAPAGGNQVITMTGGAGLTVQTLAGGGFAEINANSAGSQTVSVVNGDHIRINAAGGGAAGIYAFGGTQMVSITGTGANAITLGSAGALGPSQIIGGIQTVNAGAAGQSGSISIVGADTNATFTGISSGQILDGTQIVSTNGTLRIGGGNAPNQPPSGFATGLFHNGSGEQRVSAANLEMQGGPSGVNNTAIIISSGGAGTIASGNQVIDVADGNIELAGGAGGSNNVAIIVSFADQTVTGANVEVRGGAGGAGNGAFINIAGAGPAGSQLFHLSGDLSVAGGVGGNAGITGSANQPQTIYADNISLTNSAGGGNNSASFIQGGHQEIHAIGDVALTARASGGDFAGARIGGAGGMNATATDLRLFVGGDLVLRGGTAANNAVALGSGAALANEIYVEAGGSVILNSGTAANTGVRIGSSPVGAVAQGNIEIRAGGAIALNGTDSTTAIRTLDTVTLNAASISEAANGFILANTLATTSIGGDTTLTGPNHISSFTGTSSGDLALSNTGALSLAAVSGFDVVLTNQGDVTVNNAAVTAFGAMNLNVSGALAVNAASQNAALRSFGPQTISAGSVAVTAQNGYSASIENTPLPGVDGEQTIAVSGGNIDVLAFSGGTASIAIHAPSGTQTVTVTDGDYINVNGAGGGAVISTNGVQTIEITGSGDNAITFGSVGALGSSNTAGASHQKITAGRAGEEGSISIVGADASGAFAGFADNPVTDGTQTIFTSGTLSVVGGRSSTGTTSGVRHNGSGQQTIAASRIELLGGSLGANNEASIRADASDQWVDVDGDINVVAGAGGDALLQGIANGLQKVYADNISIANGFGGTNSFGSIRAGHQEIHATGNVVLTGGATGGNNGGVRIGGLSGVATDVQLFVDGDLVLTGGNASNNSANIGSSGGAAVPNTIYIDTGRRVVLNSGTADGARIGSGNAIAGGSIEIHADGGIEMNGTARSTVIRTLGDVILDAASISQAANGFIVANTLTTTTSGNTSLTGPNQINRFNAASGGALTLVDGGALQVTGIATTNDPITLTTGSLTNAGTITNGGPTSNANMIFNADAFNLAGGDINAGAAAVILRPRTGTNSFGIESPGMTTLTNADIEKIHTSNFVVFGSGIGTTFTGNMTIGENAQVNGGGKHLAFFRSSSPTAPGTITIGTQGLMTAGDVIVGAGNGAIVSNGGRVMADEVQLRAATGIGSALFPVQTTASALAVFNSGGVGSAFVSEADDVTLRTLTLDVGGMNNNVNNFVSGSFDLAAGGAVSVAGTVQSIGTMNLGSGGALSLDGGTQDALLLSSGGQTITAQSLSLAAQNGWRASIENSGGIQSVTAAEGDMHLHVAGGAGVAQIVNTGGDQTITVAGQLSVLGGATTGFTNSGIFKNAPGGLQSLSASRITLQGADTGSNAGALIVSQADQSVDVTGNINLIGGNGGTRNNAQIAASPTGQQTIYAHDITLGNGFGGTDTVAGLFGGHQLIDVTGNVTLASQGALVGAAPGGPGVRIGAPGASTTGTDLTLLVDGNLVIQGGTAVENGAAIGSTGAVTPPALPLPNVIHIDAGGSVILNQGTASGTGVRIGSGSSGTAGGNITIEAGGSIQLNGTQRSAAIRTLGNVSLEAASISQGTNGFILADTLTTTATSGATNLIGPNQINRFNATSGGALTLVDAGALQVTGIATTNDPITLTTGSLTNSGTISNGGNANMIFNADAFNLAGGMINAGAAAVILRPRTGTNSFGIEAAGQTTLTNADIASVHTSDFVVFGSGMGTTFTGNMTIGENAQVNGGGKHLAFFRSMNAGGTNTIGSQGVTTLGDVIVSAGGGAIVSNGGPVAGDEVQLRATQGVGAPGARVQAAASALAVNNTGPTGAFVSEADDVVLRNVNLTVGGIANNFGNFVGAGGAYDVAAGGSISLSGVVQAGDVRLGTNTSSITEAGAGAIVADTLTTNSALSTTLSGLNQVSVFNASSATGNVSFTNSGDLTFAGSALMGDLNVINTGLLNFSGFAMAGDISIANAGALNVTSLLGTNATVANHGPVAVRGYWNSFAATSITTTGAGSDLNVNTFMQSSGPMTLDIDGAVRVAASGMQDASLTAFGGQNITARAVEVTSRDGRFASIGNNNSGNQTITAFGGGIDIESVSGGGVAFITNSGGSQTISVFAGTGVDVRSVSGSGSAQINNFGSGSQTITVSGGSGVAVQTDSGTGFATIFNGAAGSQTITISGGGGIDVQALSGFAQIGSGSDQTINVVDGDHFNVNGAGGTAQVTAFNGLQTIALTGSGANALNIGSHGAQAPSQLFGANQSISAGSIQIVGSDAPDSVTGIINVGGAGRTQTIATTGAITITGGNAPSQFIPAPPRLPLLTGSNAGIFHNSDGAQTINAADLTLRGGASGLNNGAFIISNRGGDQSIHAADIAVFSGGGGINNGAGVFGATQFITTTGDVIITGAASTGQLSGTRIGGLGGVLAGPTNLTLTVGGDLRMTGGSAEFNGAAIGSTVTTPAHPNNITISASGDVVLNPGTGAGARIGSSTSAEDLALGVISITAGGKIELNGNSAATPTAIRTLGNVTLNAGTTISEGSHGRIEADRLTTVSSGDTTLNGPNQIRVFDATSSGGSVSLNNTGALDVTGLVALNDATITNIGDVTVSGTWTAGGTSTIIVGSDIRIDGRMESEDVVLAANTGAIEEGPNGSITARTLTTFSIAETQLGGANDVDVLNSTSTGGLTFNNLSDRFTLGTIQTNGGAFALDQAGDMTVTSALVSPSVNLAVGGSLALLGGSAPGSAAQITSQGPIDIRVGRDLRLAGGSGDGAFAQILGYSDINLTVGGFLTLNAGSGRGAWARIQTASRDSVISLHFPNLTSGGYFVNGVEGLLRDGKTGLLSENGVAAPDHQLVTTYGEQ